ncbi:hypothetical protein [Nonomuraea sp. JJY05]
MMILVLIGALVDALPPKPAVATVARARAGGDPRAMPPQSAR